MKVLFTGREVYIDGVKADMTSTSANITTADNQCPYLSDFEMRLILPRIMVYPSNDMLTVNDLTTHSKILLQDTKNLFPTLKTLQIRKELPSLLWDRAELFVKKSQFFHAKGICPQASAPMTVDAEIEGDYWPALQSDTCFNLQISKTFLEMTEGKIIIIPVQNANNLPPKEFTTIIERGFHHQNIVNGYYIDWDIITWETY